MDTLEIALVVVSVVVATVIAALLHERAQVADARRHAAYARERQIYEARKAILLAQRAAAAGAPLTAPAGLSRATPRSRAAVRERIDEASLPDKKHFWSRRPVDSTLPTWVYRPLRPGEDPHTPWWVRVRSIVGLAVVIGVMGVAFAGAMGALFMVAGLVLERFAS